jgi:hypothetical protein
MAVVNNEKFYASNEIVMLRLALNLSIEYMKIIVMLITVLLVLSVLND